MSKGTEPISERETFGAWLRRQRTRLGMSQASVAGKAGVTPGYISLIERSAGTAKETKPKQVVVEAIANALGLPEREALMIAGYHVPNPLANADTELEVVRVAGGRTVTIVGLDAPREDKELIKALIRRLMQPA